jgi:hypothetical protein
LFAGCGCGVKVLDLDFESRDVFEEELVFLKEGVVCVCLRLRGFCGCFLLFD